MGSYLKSQAVHMPETTSWNVHGDYLRISAAYVTVCGFQLLEAELPVSVIKSNQITDT